MNEIKPENAEIGARLHALRTDREWTIADVAKKLKLSESTIKHNESGRRGITHQGVTLYARLYNVPAGHILYGDDDEAHDDGRSVAVCIPVYGEAAGGVWMEGEDRPLDDAYAHSVSPVIGYPVSDQYARKVIGHSVSKHIRDGEYAVFVRYDRYPGGVKIGDLVDVQRIRAGLREHTVKVYRGNRLETDSDQLDKQEILALSNGDADTEVSIVGIAVGAFRPLGR